MITTAETPTAKVTLQVYGKFDMNDKPLIFKVEDIFTDIPGDDKNMNMKIPDEIMEAQGWKPGDVMKIEIGDQGTLIISKKDD